MRDSRARVLILWIFIFVKLFFYGQTSWGLDAYIGGFGTVGATYSTDEQAGGLDEGLDLTGLDIFGVHASLPIRERWVAQMQLITLDRGGEFVIEPDIANLRFQWSSHLRLLMGRQRLPILYASELSNIRTYVPLTDSLRNQYSSYDGIGFEWSRPFFGYETQIYAYGGSASFGIDTDQTNFDGEFKDLLGLSLSSDFGWWSFWANFLRGNLNSTFTLRNVDSSTGLVQEVATSSSTVSNIVSFTINTNERTPYVHLEYSGFENGINDGDTQRYDAGLGYSFFEDRLYFSFNQQYETFESATTSSDIMRSIVGANYWINRDIVLKLEYQYFDSETEGGFSSTSTGQVNHTTSHAYAAAVSFIF